jgi:metallo-beta-lactamase family protein
MTFKITFLGAAQSVTGSRYLVEANDRKVLVDCGLHQERHLRSLDWETCPAHPETIDAAFLTHAHLDHCGMLPKLVKDGFRGPIYCTPATREIAEVVLLDSAQLQMEDAETKQRRHRREGRKGPYPEAALYDVQDAEDCFPQFSEKDYLTDVSVGAGIHGMLYEAGHALGSSNVKLHVRQGGEERTILFSGDIGRPEKPILMDPTHFGQADYVVMESTYGDRVTDLPDNNEEELAECINWTVKSGGNVIIPSFAFERSQELLFYLNRLLLADTIPHLMVFLDSPMAVKITEIFQRYTDLMDAETLGMIGEGHSPFDFRGLNLVKTIGQSKAINHIKGTVIVIAGSGMCTGGRIKHHLVANISRPDSSIVFVGYQAQGTLGREIIEGARQVRIFGAQFPVRARVVNLKGFSAHADQRQLLSWVQGLKEPPRAVFITHGEPEASKTFADLVRQQTGWKTIVPAQGEVFTLD